MKLVPTVNNAELTLTEALANPVIVVLPAASVVIPDNAPEMDPPRVNDPDVVTVPLRDNPDTVPVPLTLVTVPPLLSSAAQYGEPVAPFECSTWPAVPVAPLAVNGSDITTAVAFAMKELDPIVILAALIVPV